MRFLGLPDPDDTLSWRMAAHNVRMPQDPEREQLRKRLALMEALDGIQSAIEDVNAGEQPLLDLRVVARDPKKSAIAFAHALPQDVLLAGLEAMRSKLVEQA